MRATYRFPPFLRPLRPASIAAAGALLLLPAVAAAGGGSVIVPLVLEGDSVPGVGLVTTINNIAVNGAGDWLVEADTDAAANDLVLLRNGALALREGDAPPSFPPGATLSSFDSVTLNDSGQSGFNFFLAGPPATEDSSVDAYLDTTEPMAAGVVEVIQESEEAPDLSPGTPVIGFFDVKINAAGALLVTASVDDPAIPTTVDRALYVWTTDPDAGGIVTSTLIAAEGDVLPGQAAALTDFGTGPHETAINAAGDVLFAVDITGSLDAIYRWDGSFTEIAQEGDPSPVAGRNWLTLTSTALDLGGSGGVVYRGTLDGDPATASVIVQDGAALIQEGDTLPAIGGVFTFTGFGTGPIEVGDSGDVLWFGDWNDPDTTIDTGLFLNQTLLVQEGVTTVPGLGVILTLRGVEDGYHMSDDGAFIIFEAVLASGLEGAFLIPTGLIFADGFESGDTSSWSSTVE
ncbi:MAG: DUF7453 family protein [Acidimicrobiales bacterium]